MRKKIKTNKTMLHRIRNMGLKKDIQVIHKLYRYKHGFACKLCHMNAYTICNCPFTSSKVQSQMINELWSYVQNIQKNYLIANPLNQS